MVRPCFLVVDHEYPGSISTRKLVIESAKFNVLTAYEAREAVETLERYPRVNGIVLNADVDEQCAQLVRRFKQIAPEVPVIVVSSGANYCDGEDYHVESYDPKNLIDVLESLNPDATREVRRRDLASS